MASRSNRAPASGKEGTDKPVTGDLFAHYGVVEREPVAGELPPPRKARACAGCGWYIALPGEPMCPQCGATLGSKP